MWEDTLRVLRTICASCVENSEALLQRVRDYNPSQSTVLWFQLIVAVLTIGWIVYQFTWLRRLNEARLEEYLEQKILTDHDELTREREAILAQIESIAARRGLTRVLLRGWANLLLTANFFMRVLRLGRIKDPLELSLLLMRVGKFEQARAQFTEAALDALRVTRLWEEGLLNKKLEAQSALVFAGRVAIIQKKQAAAASSFNRANRIASDPDAHILIGRQLAVAGDFQGALAEYQAALQPFVEPARSTEVAPTTRAEAHRRIAEIRTEQESHRRALVELRKARAFDAPLNNYQGLARTDELVGDAQLRQSHRTAAEKAYRDSIENFKLANDKEGSARVSRKLHRLLSGNDVVADGAITRLLDRFVAALTKQVERLRDRARKKAEKK